MMASVDQATVQQVPRPPVHWRGRSGRIYLLRSESLDDFALRGDELYLVARGNLVLWAGSGEDVIHDVQSRSRFRLALDCADRAFHVEVGGDQIERMTVVWDLEGAGPVPAQEQAAA